jgi:hypothetical protein
MGTAWGEKFEVLEKYSSRCGIPVIRKRAPRLYDVILGLKLLNAEESEVSMGKVMAAAIVLALTGSTLLPHANGTSERGPASMLSVAPDDPQEQQLRRLEQLAARVAALEDEVTRLEEKNKQLKAQLASTAPAAPPGAVPGLPVAGWGESAQNKGR